MNLVIVESPSKAKTIEKYLKPLGDYVVESSIGHIRDLPKSNKEAVLVEKGFLPKYEISAGKKKVVDKLAKLAEKSKEIILATDPDREGEAIAWHLQEVLKKKLKGKMPKVSRVTFHEITKDAVIEAMEHPGKIDLDLKKAQEARRVLDRLVGYDLSGLVWKKVRYGLSAGRVQSPALRILMERERLIRAFVPEDYFVIFGDFNKEKIDFRLKCEEEPKDKKEAERIVSIGEKEQWKVVHVGESEAKRNPKPPFTTSTMQQAASTRLGFSPSRTMRAAQRLYEAGLITYMRTDSVSMSKQAIAQIAAMVKSDFGEEYLQIRKYSSKSKNAQEAHEAIRPTVFAKKKISLKGDENSLYKLIWSRAAASMMASAQVLRTKLSANVENGDIPNFSVTGFRMIFQGWYVVDQGALKEDVLIPPLKVGDIINLKDIILEEKQTEPPNRYTEAGLIKELEKRGIGRPSTYASIMRTLIDRGYVTKEGRTLFPTDTGDVVSSFLEDNFAEYIGDDFTATMEDKLDDIARGEREYESTLSEFYTPFTKDLKSKEDIPKVTNLGEADPKFKCPECGASMVIKLGRVGKFLSCSRYPECEGALTIDGERVTEGEPIGKHPKTGEDIYVLSGKFGPYVQLGKKTKENPKPRRAGLEKGMKVEDVTVEVAVKLLTLPRILGIHPEKDEKVIANIGRFGPYVGVGREFRSLKKGDDPYTVTFERALEILSKPKGLPKGVELVKVLGKHPKTGKDIQLLKSKSGHFVRKGLKRFYIDEDKVKKFDLEAAVALLAGK